MVDVEGLLFSPKIGHLDGIATELSSGVGGVR